MSKQMSQQIPQRISQQGQRGFSLIELIVALALGATLAAGISSVYLENKKNYVMDEEVARLQENGRFAVDILKREIKMAGFFGGIKDIPAPTAANAIGSGCQPTDLWTLNTTRPIDVIDDAKKNFLHTSSGGAMITSCVNPADVYGDFGNDVLILKRLADRPSISSGIVDPGVVNSSGNIAPHTGWYLVEGPASKSYVRSVTLSAGPFVGAAISGSGDSSGVKAWLYHSKIYWVRDCSVCTPSKDGIPTLVVTYLDDDVYRTDPLVEGVEAFHLEFGLASASAAAESRAAEIFTPNPTNAELPRVSVVRLYLLLRTREKIRDYTDTNIYVLGTKPAIDKSASPDNYKRKLFTTTITVRNT